MATVERTQMSGPVEYAASIAAPREWINETSVLITAPFPSARTGVTPSFLATCEDLSSDLQGANSENMATFANRYAERLKRGYAGFELTADMAQSGKTGLWEITFHCEVEGFAITQWITLSALNNNRALVTTAGAGREDFPALVNIFHNMRKSLNFS